MNTILAIGMPGGWEMIIIGLIVSIGLSLIFIIYVIYLSSLNNKTLLYDMNKNLIDEKDEKDKESHISFFDKLYY